MSLTMDRWAGRVALVTGASSGIGAGICRELVKHGMTVIGCARKYEAIQSLGEEYEVKTASGKLVAMKCDLMDEKDILLMFEQIKNKFGRIDLCVNNAGVIFNAPLLTGSTEQWRNILDVNVMALCICTREAVKLMKETNVEEGQIIHISSVGGHYIPNMGMHGIHFYCGTKFMVRALTEGLRMELKALGNRVRIASISPGMVETNISGNYASEGESNLDEIFNSIKAMTPQDVANSVVHILASPPNVEVHDIIVRPFDQTV